MKILITGATGFVGRHLTKHLLEDKNATVFGTYLTEKKVEVTGNSKFYKLDLNQEESVSSLIQEIKPELVFHLAASTSPNESFGNPSTTMINNISSQINLLEAIRKQDLDILHSDKILVCSYFWLEK